MWSQSEASPSRERERERESERDVGCGLWGEHGFLWNLNSSPKTQIGYKSSPCPHCTRRKETPGLHVASLDNLFFFLTHKLSLISRIPFLSFFPLSFSFSFSLFLSISLSLSLSLSLSILSLSLHLSNLFSPFHQISFCLSGNSFSLSFSISLLAECAKVLTAALDGNSE